MLPAPRRGVNRSRGDDIGVGKTSPPARSGASPLWPRSGAVLFSGAAAIQDRFEGLDGLLEVKRPVRNKKGATWQRPRVFQPGEGQALDLGPNRWFTKRGTAGSEVVVGEIELSPGSDLPPAHSHKPINEAFYVLEGEVELTDGKRTWRAGPGTAMDIPTGGVHGITRVVGGKQRT